MRMYAVLALIGVSLLIACDSEEQPAAVCPEFPQCSDGVMVEFDRAPRTGTVIRGIPLDGDGDPTEIVCGPCGTSEWLFVDQKPDSIRVEVTEGSRVIVKRFTPVYEDFPSHAGRCQAPCGVATIPFDLGSD